MRIPEDGKLRRFLYVIMGSFTVVNVVWVAVFLAQCRPISGLWDPAHFDGCWNRNIELVVSYTQGGKFRSWLPFLWNELDELTFFLFVPHRFCHSHGPHHFSRSHLPSLECANGPAEESSHLCSDVCRLVVSSLFADYQTLGQY